MTSLFEATGEGGGRARVEVRIQGTVRPQPSWHAAISGVRMSSPKWRCYWKRASTPVCPGWATPTWWRCVSAQSIGMVGKLT